MIKKRYRATKKSYRICGRNATAIVSYDSKDGSEHRTLTILVSSLIKNDQHYSFDASINLGTESTRELIDVLKDFLLIQMTKM